MGKTALVLSAGGMFGAYQAGAWHALSTFFRPDLIVGASIGSLNGWAIAGECSPGGWVDTWLTLEQASRHRLRFPKSLRQGIWDPAPFEQWIQQLYAEYSPRIPVGLVVTELARLRPRLVCTPNITWQHLAASCGVPGLLPLPKIDGQTYLDGGILGALPLWAAAHMGAKCVVAIHALKTPPLVFRAGSLSLRALARKLPDAPEEMKRIVIAPAQPLGGTRAAFYWNRNNVQRWVDAGYKDAFAWRPAIEEMLAESVSK